MKNLRQLSAQPPAISFGILNDRETRIGRFDYALAIGQRLWRRILIASRSLDNQFGGDLAKSQPESAVGPDFAAPHACRRTGDSFFELRSNGEAR
jgi:hypothetical protein